MITIDWRRLQCRLGFVLIVCSGLSPLAGCHHGGGGSDSGSGNGGGGSGGGGGNGPYTISGTVSGLAGSGLVLQNNGGDDLAVAGTGFEFPTPVADGEAYAVTIKSDPTGQYCSVTNAGGTVNGANVANVQVGCGSWAAPQLLENDDTGNAFYPRVSLDAAGNAMVVWHQTGGGLNSIWARRYVSGSGWSDPELIEHDDVHNTAYPEIAMDSAGNAVAVWLRSTGGQYDLMANRYTLGAGWGTEQLIETSDSGQAVAQSIAIDADGNVLVLWQQPDSSPRYHIWYNRYTPGGGWEGASLVETHATGDAMYPELAFLADGSAMAVWIQSEGAIYSTWSSRYTPNGGWETPVLIENDDSSHAIDPKIAALDDGSFVAVWQQGGSILANRYTAAAGWSGPEPVELNDQGVAYDPQLVADGRGHALVTWTLDTAAGSNIWSNGYHRAGGWGTAQQIESHTTGYAYSQRLAGDGAGNAMVVWEQDSDDQLWVNHYALAGGWGTPMLLSDGSNQVYGADIAFGDDGSAMAVWYQSVGALNNIQGSRFE